MAPQIDPFHTTDEGDGQLTPPDTGVSPFDDTAMPGGPRNGMLIGLTGPPKIGRYVFLERLGKGGMGEVVAAYDPKLDRKVAIKLIHTVHRDDMDKRLRMEREAQAMARLSHPNVVTVYEVGEYEGQLFLAIELVKGRDLSRWLMERKESTNWRETLEVFLQAGHGLAAAHRAGLVHRDFKPGNVFVGDDGRVRVGDFGLARQEREEAGNMATRLRACVEKGATALANSLTKTGAVMGTPGYMAPEQFLGQTTDARTDQFSFCVALWEGLYGRRPFAGTRYAELMMNVTEGKRLPAPAGSVPIWVRRVLERGLAVAPEERFATTEAMLAALKADPTRRRRVLGSVAALGLVVAAWFGGTSYLEARQVAACEAEGATIFESWSQEDHERLRDGILATGVPYAEAAVQNTTRYLDAQAGAWMEARSNTCLDTWVAETWDEELALQSIWCLDERRMEFTNLVEQLTSGSLTSVQHAVVAAASLSHVDPCRDSQRLRRLPELPSEQQQVKSILEKLSRVRALSASGEYDEGLKVASATLALAEEVDWPPLVAAARWHSAELLELSGKHDGVEAAFEEAYFQAANAGALEVAADAAISLSFTVGVEGARHAEGLRWKRHADLLLAELGEEEQSLRRADVFATVALLYHAKGEYDEAAKNVEGALSIREDLLGKENPVVAETKNDLAVIASVQGHQERAEVLHKQVLETLERELGPLHPDVATALNNLGAVYSQTGRFSEAREIYLRSLSNREQSLGPDHPQVAASLSNLAELDTKTGAYESAIALNEKALALKEKVYGSMHPEVAFSLNNLGNTENQRGGYQAAIPLHERALAIRRAALKPNHPDIAFSLNNLGQALGGLGRYHEASELYQEALEIFQAAFPPEHPLIPAISNNLAQSYYSMRAYERAQLLQTKVLAQREKILPPNHPDIATSLNNLGKTFETQKEFKRAQDYHSRALAIRKAAFGPAHPDVAQSLNNLANTYYALGALSDAKKLYHESLKIREDKFDLAHPKLIFPLMGLSRVALSEGETADALDHAERGMRICQDNAVDPLLKMQMSLTWARALWHAQVGEGRNRKQALALAREARDFFTQRGGKRELRNLKKYLDQRHES